MLRSPSNRQKALKAPACSGMVTANTASRFSPTSARSAIKRKRSKFMLAPEAMPIKVLSLKPWRLAYSFMPAVANAPAGSRMLRVSSNTSLMAAQMASLSTTIISSTNCWAKAKVCSPTCLTAAPSANKPTCSSMTRLPCLSDSVMASASLASTPMTFISGRTALTYAAIPASKPPPPTQQNIASIGSGCALRISMAMVPWPAMTSGSSYGCTKVSCSDFSNSKAFT